MTKPATCAWSSASSSASVPKSEAKTPPRSMSPTTSTGRPASRARPMFVRSAWRRLISAGLPAPSQTTTSKRARRSASARATTGRSSCFERLVGARVRVGVGLAHDDDLAVALARRLDEDRVHRGLGLDPGGRRLHGLRAPDLRAVARHDRVQRHVLRLERRDADALAVQPAADAGRDDGLAGIRVRAADEDRAVHRAALRPSARPGGAPPRAGAAHGAAAAHARAARGRRPAGCADAPMPGACARRGRPRQAGRRRAQCPARARGAGGRAQRRPPTRRRPRRAARRGGRRGCRAGVPRRARGAAPRRRRTSAARRAARRARRRTRLRPGRRSGSGASRRRRARFARRRAPSLRRRGRRAPSARPSGERRASSSRRRAARPPSRSRRSARCGARPSRRACWPRGTRRRPPARAIAPQTSAPTTASLVFSATDSTAARQSCASSRPAGSRPHSDGSTARAPSRSPSSTHVASRRASPASERPPSAAQVTAASAAPRPAPPRAAARAQQLAGRAGGQHQPGRVQRTAQPRRPVRRALDRERDVPEPRDRMPAPRVAEEHVGRVAADERRAAHVRAPAVPRGAGSASPARTSEWRFDPA